MSRPKYRVSPSLLNKWTSLVNSDRDWEQFHGDKDEPSVTPEEFFARRERELLDAINRVPFVSEPASRGTALNEMVDCIVENRKPRPDMLVERVHSPADGRLAALRAELDGFAWFFDAGLVRSLGKYFAGSVCQHRCEAEIETDFGPVIVYGDADYIRRDLVLDLKTTARYDRYGKYSEGWQKAVYPYALTESGEAVGISGFVYVVVPLKGENPVTGEIREEYYPYDHEAARGEIRGALEAFIPWVEEHREQITHKRIFNEI